MNSIEQKILLSRVNCVSNSEVRLIIGEVVFNIKPVDKTIAVKYPHFFNHNVMMSAEITLLNHGPMMSTKINLGRSRPLKVEARRCHRNPCA